MKKLIYLLLVLPIFLFSCKSVPEANFYTDTVKPEVGRDVHFTNDSHNASRFEWDFGDGFVSNEDNPAHYYTATGPYEVKLTAISRDGLEDVAKLSLNVMVPTLLEIEVREYYDEYVVPDASVILYPSITDWEEEKNKLDEGFTDVNGIAVFSNLDPYVYYVDVWESTHDNYTLKSEDIAFIRTPEVLPNQINRFIAWVDVADHSTAKGARSFVIKKFERKATDKRQPDPVTGTENWQELYAKSIHKKK
jgi:PKD repeat protein